VNHQEGKGMTKPGLRSFAAQLQCYADMERLVQYTPLAYSPLGASLTPASSPTWSARSSTTMTTGPFRSPSCSALSRAGHPRVRRPAQDPLGCSEAGQTRRAENQLLLGRAEFDLLHALRLPEERTR
jgi:hypothetical protein